MGYVNVEDLVDAYGVSHHWSMWANPLTTDVSFPSGHQIRIASSSLTLQLDAEKSIDNGTAVPTSLARGFGQVFDSIPSAAKSTSASCLYPSTN
jgi:hypothetical protein